MGAVCAMIFSTPSMAVLTMMSLKGFCPRAMAMAVEAKHTSYVRTFSPFLSFSCRMGPSACGSDTAVPFSPLVIVGWPIFSSCTMLMKTWGGGGEGGLSCCWWWSSV